MHIDYYSNKQVVTGVDMLLFWYSLY